MTVPTDAEVQALVRAVLDLGDFPGRAELLVQSETVAYRDGPITMMNLTTDHALPPATGVESPIPNGLAAVYGADGEAIGMLLVWLSPEGYLDCLEYAWVTDEMPTVLPGPDQVR